MDSFIFDIFKKNILEGNVNQETTWQLFPVNKKFTEDMADTLKYIKHTYDIPFFQSSANNPDTIEKNIMANHVLPNMYLTNMMAFNYTYRSMYETDQPSQPLYVDADNFDKLIENSILPLSEQHLKTMFFEDGGCFNRNNKKKGFYYVKTSEELLWCANTVNGIQFDNTINIVLGDNIGIIDESINIDNIDGETNNILNREKLKKIRYSIGSNPAQPYNGIFFGNGYSFVNIELICENDVTGIFGYLGYDGIISTAYIRGFNIVTCNKKINMDHLITNGTDVYAGLLCGKNNGKITNVCIDGTVTFNGFVPSIYSVNNKTENRSEENPGNYDYYPDFYCFDSPGNIIPYIGYFNEGVFATYSAYEVSQGHYSYPHYWNTDMTYKTLRYDSKGNVVSPKEWFYWGGTSEASIGNFIHYTRPADRFNVLWYDGQIIANTNALHGVNGLSICENGLYNYGDGTSGTIEKYNRGDTMKNIRYADYFNKSIKLSEQNRVAYYVSPLVGFNNNIINDSIINAKLFTSGTFVGFMGGVAGMQSDGLLNNVKTSISAYDVIDYSNTQGLTLYKRDYYSATQLPFPDRDSGEKLYINFPQKSIKNISSLFGSCVIGSLNALKLYDVDSYFNNFNNIPFRADYDGEPLYDDYYFMNRFGAFAAIVEYHSSNISDMWKTKEEANDITKRSILAHNCKFSYKESLYYPNNSMDFNINLTSIRNIGSNIRYSKHALNDMCGVAAPLFAELKPIFKTVPSVISTFYNNIGALVTKSTDETSKFYHIGLFGVDQNFAAPPSDADFRCVDFEVDLPGVANGNISESNHILAGGVVDHVNNLSALNFSTNIEFLPSSLINWDETKSYVVNNNRSVDSKPFAAVRIPEATKIENPYYGDSQRVEYYHGDIDITKQYNTTAKLPDGVYLCGKKSAFDYCANKLKHDYSYYGSDLKLLIQRDAAPLYSDLGRTNGKITFQFLNDAYWNYSAYGMSNNFECNDEHDRYLANGVSAIKMTIDGKAFDYMPFTDKEISQDLIKEYYDIQLWRTNANGSHFWTSDRNNTWVKPAEYDNKILFRIGDAFKRDDAEQAMTDFYGTPDVSGFAFYIDRAKPGRISMLYFVIPFNIVPYGIYQSNSANPPYQKFEGFYVEGQVDEDESLPVDWDAWAGHSKPTRHNYFIQDPNFTPKIEGATFSTPHQSWLGTNFKGRFVNAFTSGVESNREYLANATSEDRTAFKQLTAYLCTGDNNNVSGEIFDNIIKGKENKDDNENVTNFRYTYDKDYGTKIKPPFLLPVKYDNKNGKNGFWFQAPAASGEYEYNDNLNYYGNIYYIGKTLSQDALLKKCLLIDSHEWQVSGISADDFEGLYVQDSDQNPIMYIDVSLGECQDGTTWSLSSYPSVDSSAFIENYKIENPDDGNDKIQAALNKALNRSSGLFLEVKLDEKQ